MGFQQSRGQASLCPYGRTGLNKKSRFAAAGTTDHQHIFVPGGLGVFGLRLEDVQRSCKILGIPLIVGEYDDKEWLQNAKGLENAPEKGERCSFCFDFRLNKTAQIAKKTHCTEFTTTLLASPMKLQSELFAQGEVIAKSWNLGLEFIGRLSRKSSTV